MTDLSDIYETRWPSGGVTFAEPLASDRFADMFSTAEKQQRLVNNAFAADQSREAAYDRRIAAVKAATGQELENPERGGYSLSERDMRRLTRDGPIDPMAYRRDQFEQQLGAIRNANPDKADALTFDDINAEAKATAKGAEIEGSRETGAGAVKTIGAELAGGLWGSRRDPLFIGSLFAGPTSALGKAAFTRIASSALFQGLYNAGLTAAEQPAVQAWRAEIGAKSGVIPALENVGTALVLGMIPGAAVQGVKEAIATPLRRVLTGHPETGDLEAVHAGLTPAAPRGAAALAAGAESTAADRATLTIPEPKGVTPELHDDMLAAALKRADDPAEPSPEAVAAVRELEDYKTIFEGKESEYPAVARHMAELNQRIAEAAPKSEREAVQAADEAMDDIGRREGMNVLRDSMDQVAADRETARAERVAAEAIEPAPKPAKDDPMGVIPWLDDKGKPDTITARQMANLGKRDEHMNMVVLGCQA